MIYRDKFSSFHPAVNFLFFGLIFTFSMFLTHPVILIISFLSAFTYAVYLDGSKTVIFCFKFLLPVMLAAALTEPMFSHEGITVLCYLPSGNPLTLESVFYGISASVMLGAVIIWFRCFTIVMTADKFIYLFGKLIPSLSLMISMTLRFVPRFMSQFEEVRNAQYCIRRDTLKGNIFKRIGNTVIVFSIVVTWALENAVETANSMKSRGYGLKGRTAFSIYKLDSRDKTALIWLVSCGFTLICGISAKGLKWRYFPSVAGTLARPFTICFFTVYLLLCSTPFILSYRSEFTPPPRSDG